MRRSSANQPAPEFLSEETAAGAADRTVTESVESSRASSATAAVVNFPEFHSSIYAVTARRAGRLNAANIPQREVDDLLRERQQLLDKQFEGTITREEAIRLTYVRWSLSRIEDARYGEALDRMES